uniref:Uncharacterized protein n=1 Tax=Anguilla anguilla TaxID=7936 RepID=A0A0E9VQV1_ANGAN
MRTAEYTISFPLILPKAIVPLVFFAFLAKS